MRLAVLLMAFGSLLFQNDSVGSFNINSAAQLSAWSQMNHRLWSNYRLISCQMFLRQTVQNTVLVEDILQKPIFEKPSYFQHLPESNKSVSRIAAVKVSQPARLFLTCLSLGVTADQAEASLKEFSLYYKRQFSVAHFSQVEEDLEQHKEKITQLLKQRVCCPKV